MATDADDHHQATRPLRYPFVKSPASARPSSCSQTWSAATSRFMPGQCEKDTVFYAHNISTLSFQFQSILKKAKSYTPTQCASHDSHALAKAVLHSSILCTHNPHPCRTPNVCKSLIHHAPHTPSTPASSHPSYSTLPYLMAELDQDKWKAPCPSLIAVLNFLLITSMLE